jgi:FtsP/CotA-like multicopper oxidase with cupredoxin domain
MVRPPLFPTSRRQVLAGLALTSLALRAGAQPSGNPKDSFRLLRAQPGTLKLKEPRPTTIWSYDGTAPGPTLRIRRGEELRVRLVNELPEPTAVHWHGVRLPNAMDGVPGLTQPAIAPGASFDYVFRPPDAGTFLYRPAGNASSQIARGLRGALIIDESDPVAVDRDVLLILEDWPTAPGKPLTINGASDIALPVRSNERLRLRLANATSARALVLRVERHAPLVVAIDGQPSEPFVARDGRLALAPGNRIDLFLDLPLRAGERAAILIEDVSAPRPLVHLVYQGEPFRSAPLPDAKPLPPNPLPARLDLRGAARHELALEALATLPATLHERPPLFTVRRGRIVVLAINNRTDATQTVHLHGHHVRLLDRLDDGWKPYWLDTITVPARQTDRVAFLADNPGKWLIEAQAMGGGAARAGAWFAVT